MYFDSGLDLIVKLSVNYTDIFRLIYAIFLKHATPSPLLGKKNMQEKKSITLKHLLINNEKRIGLKYYRDKILEALVDHLPGVQWSDKFGMHHISNKPKNVDIIFNTFKEVAWINVKYFYRNKPKFDGGDNLNLDHYRNREQQDDWRYIPNCYLNKLERMKYALNTS
ncbi:MAG: hypothetical protein AAGK97_17800, partial [Bacteroidota bacterium]